MDMLVKLYELPDATERIKALEAEGICIRRPIGPENYAVIDWISENFARIWGPISISYYCAIIFAMWLKNIITIILIRSCSTLTRLKYAIGKTLLTFVLPLYTHTIQSTIELTNTHTIYQA